MVSSALPDAAVSERRNYIIKLHSYIKRLVLKKIHKCVARFLLQHHGQRLCFSTMERNSATFSFVSFKIFLNSYY